VHVSQSYSDAEGAELDGVPNATAPRRSATHRPRVALAQRLRVPAVRRARSRHRRRAAALSLRRLPKQTSLKANTIFQRTLLPLSKWFQGMYFLTQSKNSISGLELARQRGVRPDTAALMRHTLMIVMEAREAARKLDGRVEMDDVKVWRRLTQGCEELDCHFDDIGVRSFSRPARQ
jgi:hypothetical protein